MIVRHVLCIAWILVLLSYSRSAYADVPVKGRPFTQYYGPSDYGAGSNNYNTVRDARGVFYFSNDEGVLTFDGSEWSLIPIKDNRPVYWVEIDRDGSILVASTGEIGRLVPDVNGTKVYETLLESSEEMPFENVWEVAVTSRESIFRSRKLLMHYSEGKVTTIGDLNNKYDVAFTANDTIYVRIYGKGIFYVRNSELHMVPGSEFFADKKLNSFLPYDDKLLVATRKEGLFLIGNGIVSRFTTEADELFKEYRIYHGCMTQDGNYAYAAYIKGVAIINKEGKLLQLLDEEAGLPIHQYLSVEASDPRSLWMTHAVGISQAEILSPVSYFDQAFGIEDVVTDIKIHDDQLYVTTLKGFYNYSTVSNRFTPINNEYLQEFHGVTIVDNNVYAGGQQGLMMLEDGELRHLRKTNIHQLSSHSDYKWFLMGSGESGFEIIYPHNQELLSTRLNGYKEQVKKIIQLENKLALVSFFGKLHIVKIESEAGVPKPEIEKEVYLGDFGTVKLDNALLVITPDGWQKLDVNEEVIDRGILPISGVSKIQFISDAVENTFWICYKNETRVNYCEKWVFKDKELSSTSTKFKPGFKINAISRGNDNTDWFGGDEGLIRYDGNTIQGRGLDDIACHISQTIINGDSIIKEAGLNTSCLELPNKNASLQFKYYSDQSFSSTGDVLFQYKLDQLDEEWSSWSSQTSKEYTKLPPSEYTFKVRARNSSGQISNVASLTFEIPAPWYASWWSYLLYIILGGMGIWGFVRWRTKSLKLAKAHLEEMVKGRTAEVERQKKSLEVQSENLRQANATKVQLYSIIGHDLRSPLNSIQDLTNLIKHYRSEKQPEQVDDLMEHMSTSVKGLSHLLDNLLSWTMNQSGNFEVKKVTIELKNLVADVVIVLNETALSKDLSILVDMDEKIELSADMNSLGTVLRNLLSNAIKFSHKGGKIWINARENATHVIIEVEDEGVGIAKEKIHEIFHLSNTTYGTDNERGTGLGLTLVQDFVQLNGGEIKVKSKLDKGTCFELSFPK